MLIQFRFKNFKSFRDDTILDLSATKITEHSDRVVAAGKEKLLPAAAIYGANASGKSNVIKAFRFMTTYVLESFYPYTKESKYEKPKYSPFLFDSNSRAADSSFEVYFLDTAENGYKSYNYGFVLNQGEIVEEWLNYKAKTSKEYKRIFYRSRDELDLSGMQPEKVQENIKIALKKEVLIISLGMVLNIPKLEIVYRWFYNNNFADFGNPVEDVMRSSSIPKWICKR